MFLGLADGNMDPNWATKGWGSSTERGFSAWKAATEDSEGAWNLWVEETHYEKTKGVLPGYGFGIVSPKMG